MKNINLESFIGTTLVAKDPCYMDGYSNQHPTLTVGKEYEIIDYRGNDIIVEDDDGDLHQFKVNLDGSFKSWKCNVTGKTVIPFLYVFNAEPKQESHICKYCNAETTQPDDECYAKPKQETIEEAAEKYVKHFNI